MIQEINKKHPGGRPSIYTQKLADEICRRLAQGESLVRICRDDGMPDTTTVFDWIRNKQEFSLKYAKARQDQAEKLADEIFDISDDGQNDWMEIETQKGNVIEVPNHEHINRSRLRVDTRKWYLSKVLPKIYGDKLAVEHSGEVKHVLTDKLKEARERVIHRIQNHATN